MNPPLEKYRLEEKIVIENIIQLFGLHSGQQQKLRVLFYFSFFGISTEEFGDIKTNVLAVFLSVLGVVIYPAEGIAKLVSISTELKK